MHKGQADAAEVRGEAEGELAKTFVRPNSTKLPSSAQFAAWHKQCRWQIMNESKNKGSLTFHATPLSTPPPPFHPVVVSQKHMT